MNGDQQVKINPIMAIAILFELIFIVFVIITINSIFSHDQKMPEIKIDNYSVASDNKITVNGKNYEITDDHKAVLGTALYNLVKLNNSDNVDTSGAKIREDSVKSIYREDNDTYYMYFIVDIEDLGQSYRVAYRQKNEESVTNDTLNESPFLAFCPKETDLIYGEFECIDEYKGMGETRLVYDMISGKPFSNFTVGMLGDVANNGQLSLLINTKTDSESDKNAAVKELSDYLSSLGINLEDYEYSVGLSLGQ